MRRKKVIVVAGARPNFMKAAPLIEAFKKYKEVFEILLVHTGQHYDFEMSEIFFKNLNIPKPGVYLNAGSGSHAVQTAKIMISFERVVLKERPDLVIVVGDVNSTLACALVASKLRIKVAHIESGLRSFDRNMPEEINRILTDSLADYLFASEESGVVNLKREGINKNKVYFAGNIMIDTLLANMKSVSNSDILERLRLGRKKYCVITLHRPDNVDTSDSIFEIYDILKSIVKKITVVYPVHPRTKKMLKKYEFLGKFKELCNLKIVNPLGYIDFVRLIKDAKFVLTDSGGIQEETTVLKVPCLTMRKNTERPVTLIKGTNYLVDRDEQKILKHVDNILDNKYKKGTIPRFWDGMASDRIINALKKEISK